MVDANVDREGTRIYCFYNLPYEFDNVTVYGFLQSTEVDLDEFFQVGVPGMTALADYGACDNTPPSGTPGVEDAFVSVFDASLAANGKGGFFIVFN